MFVKIGILLLALGISLFAVVGIVIQQTGLMIVDVQDRDRHIFLPIPMIFVNTALKLTPIASHIDIPDRVNRHYMSLQDAATELSKCPDGPLVEVQDRRDNVMIEKRGANLIVDVKSDHENVHLQIPIQATGKAIAQLASLKSGPE
jgi:hypothetical protein